MDLCRDASMMRLKDIFPGDASPKRLYDKLFIALI